MKIYLGRYVYGLAAILFGILAVTWNDFNLWQQVRPLGAFPGREILLYVVAAVAPSARFSQVEEGGS